jgi:DNA-binding NarL/FixJ family response regulator
MNRHALQVREGGRLRELISVVVVEFETVLLRRFRNAVSTAPGLRLAGTARSVAQARRVLDETSPNVVLTELALPDGNGLDVIRHAKHRGEASDVIVVTKFADDEHVIGSLRAGATGYLLKEASSRDVTDAIVEVHAGGAPISPSIARRLLQMSVAHAQQDALESQPDKGSLLLSTRETEILQLIAKGLTFKEVGTILTISPHTVVTHVKRVYHKLQVHSRCEAVYEANHLGLL